MGVEPFDLDEPGGGTDAELDRELARDAGAAGAPAPVRRRHRSTASAVAIAASAAVVGGAVGGLAVHSHLLAARHREEASQVRLVATASDLVAARTARARVSEVVLSLQLVNAGPRRVQVRAVSADGGGRALHAISPLTAVASAQSARLVLSGPVTCRDRSAARTTRVTVRVRTADGRTRTADLGSETAVRWTSALQRACALPYATP